MASFDFEKSSRRRTFAIRLVKHGRSETNLEVWEVGNGRRFSIFFDGLWRPIFFVFFFLQTHFYAYRQRRQKSTIIIFDRKSYYCDRQKLSRRRFCLVAVSRMSVLIFRVYSRSNDGKTPTIPVNIIRNITVFF